MATKSPTAAGRAALALIDATVAFVHSDGSVAGVTGLNRRTVEPLIRDGLAAPCGPATPSLRGHKSQRLIVTLVGRQFLSN